jgi:hypothetical protein
MATWAEWQAAYAALEAEKHPDTRAAQDILDAEIRAAYKARFPRRKFPAYTVGDVQTFNREKVRAALGEAIYDALVKPHLERHSAACEAHFARKKALEEALAKITKETELPDGERRAVKENWTKCHTVSDSDYRSQGWSAAKYARESAQGYADDLQANGIPSEVRRVERKIDGCREPLVDFEVWAACSEVGCVWAHYRPGQTLREWVRSCWKRGVNPRVYNPFLPVGYEEKAGLDYFGGEKAKQA